MVSYSIKFGLCLALLLVLYILFLEKEKMHRFNRFFLLGSIALSLIAPLVIIYVETNISNQIIQTPLNLNAEYNNSSIFTINNFLVAIYLLGGLVFCFRFTKNIVAIIQKINQNEQEKINNITYVLIEEDTLPYTFFNYIFVNKRDYVNSVLESELYTHEITHAKQKHSIDIIIVEIFQILFWFNPVFIWLKKAIQLNHEFLADASVIASHNNISHYQNLLINTSGWDNNIYLASNLNYSLTKKRLIMMTTTSSKLSILLKKIAIIPLSIGFIFVFAQRVEAQSKTKKAQVVEVKKETSATKKQMEQYEALAEKVQKNNRITMKEREMLYYIYNQMSNKQKKSVKNVNKVVPPLPKIKEIKEKKPAKTLKTKNGKKPEVVELKVKLHKGHNKTKKGKTSTEIIEVDSNSKK